MHISSGINYIVHMSDKQQQGPDLDCAAVQRLVGSVSVPDGTEEPDLDCAAVQILVGSVSVPDGAEEPDLDCAAVQILVGSVSVPDGAEGWHTVPEGHPDRQQGVSAGIAKSPSAGVAMGTHSLLWGQGAAAFCQR